MIRFFAKRRAEPEYVTKLELEAATNDINAPFAMNRAKEKRAYIDQLNREPDDIEANIAKAEANLEQGYWLCDNGHENRMSCGCASPGGPAFVHIADCDKRARLQ